MEANKTQFQTAKKKRNFDHLFLKIWNAISSLTKNYFINTFVTVRGISKSAPPAKRKPHGTFSIRLSVKSCTIFAESIKIDYFLLFTAQKKCKLRETKKKFN